MHSVEELEVRILHRKRFSNCFIGLFNFCFNTLYFLDVTDYIFFCRFLSVLSNPNYKIIIPRVNIQEIPKCQ